MQVVLDRFEPLAAYFGPPKTPTCLENGLLQDQTRKMGQKWVKKIFLKKWS